MKSIIQNSLENSYSYTDYRKHISFLLKEGKSSGKEQTESLFHYSELNEVRMNRLDKTIQITVENKNKINLLKRNYIWLVIAEGWCGDVAQILPVFNKMASISEKIELKIVLRDENEALMNLFLTNRTRSIPKLILLDKSTLDVLADFGPRPKPVSQFMIDYKTKNGFIDETAKAELQMWYFRDKGISIQNEILEIISTLE